MSSDCDWRDPKAIDRWADEWREDPDHETLGFTGQHDPLDELRHRLERGDFAGVNRASVAAYLKLADEKAHRLSESGKADREERAIAAAEKSAESSERSEAFSKRSASAAEKSARWSGWAIALALAALFVTAWPHIREWFA